MDATRHSFTVSTYSPVPKELLFKSGVLPPHAAEYDGSCLDSKESAAYGNYQRGIYGSIWRIHWPEFLIHFHFPSF